MVRFASLSANITVESNAKTVIIMIYKHQPKRVSSIIDRVSRFTSAQYAEWFNYVALIHRGLRGLSRKRMNKRIASK